MMPIVAAQQSVDFFLHAPFLSLALFPDFRPSSRHGKSNWHNWLGNCVGRLKWDRMGVFYGVYPRKGVVPRMSQEGGSAIGSKVRQGSVG